MATLPEPLTLPHVLDAGVAVMSAASGALKTIAPPDKSIQWSILATFVASIAFLSAKLLLGLTDLRLTRNFWLVTAIVAGLAAIISGRVYFLTRSARTLPYPGGAKVVGTENEYLPRVAADLQNRTREKLLEDAAGKVEEVWTGEGLARSRRRLATGYIFFVGLLAFALYLGIEALNAPKAEPSFADKIANLKDIHFDVDQANLSGDAAQLLNADADILKDVLKQFPKATVILEGYCDDRGNDDYNFALGYKRAEAARQALVAAQIGKDKLTLTSHGRKDAACPPKDEACHQRNRRVHLTVIQN
jgi:outer membrane protein OmpA-like peptidoglycan-associated protein